MVKRSRYIASSFSSLFFFVSAVHIIIIYTRGACAFTERTAFLVLLSRSARRKHAHTHTHTRYKYTSSHVQINTHDDGWHSVVHFSPTNGDTKSWQKIICNAAILQLLWQRLTGGIERHRWRSAPAPGCPPLTRCAQRRPCQGRTLRDARCTPHESNRQVPLLFGKKILVV